MQIFEMVKNKRYRVNAEKHGKDELMNMEQATQQMITGLTEDMVWCQMKPLLKDVTKHKIQVAEKKREAERMGKKPMKRRWFEMG